MASESKKSKTDKRHSWGRGGNFLKFNNLYLKGVAFFNSSQRQSLKNELRNLTNEL